MIHDREPVIILKWHLIQILKVDTYSYLTILLPNWDDIGYPCWMVDMVDNPCFKHLINFIEYSIIELRVELPLSWTRFQRNLTYKFSIQEFLQIFITPRKKILVSLQQIHKFFFLSNEKSFPIRTIFGVSLEPIFTFS